MTLTIEQASISPPARRGPGRPSRPVKNLDTGQTFDDAEKAAEWLGASGVNVLPQTIRSCIGEERPAGGFRWDWAGPAPRGGRGPLPGCGGRPAKGATRPVNVVPRTPVVDSDGECYRDAEVAAEVMRAAGHPADAKGVVRAILTGEQYAGRYFDWKGRAEFFCGVEAETGEKCDGCRERSRPATVTVAAVVDVGG